MKTDSTSASDGASTLTIRERWDSLMSSYNEARAADAAINAVYDEATKSGSETDDHSKIEADWISRGDDLHQARDNLLLALAPDFAAVQWKMAQLFSEGDYEGDQYICAWNRKFTDAVMADLARLQGEFVEAWLEAWTGAGGNVCFDQDGKHAWFGFPTFDGSPEYAALSDDQRASPDIMSHLDIRYHARMNGRIEDLQFFPGGVEVIKQHMRSKGLTAIFRQREVKA
jgi:hypothetical protein